MKDNLTVYGETHEYWDELRRFQSDANLTLDMKSLLRENAALLAQNSFLVSRAKQMADFVQANPL